MLCKCRHKKNLRKIVQFYYKLRNTTVFYIYICYMWIDIQACLTSNIRHGCLPDAAKAVYIREELTSRVDVRKSMTERQLVLTTRRIR